VLRCREIHGDRFTKNLEEGGRRTTYTTTRLHRKRGTIKLCSRMHALLNLQQALSIKKMKKNSAGDWGLQHKSLHSWELDVPYPGIGERDEGLVEEFRNLEQEQW